MIERRAFSLNGVSALGIAASMLACSSHDLPGENRGATFGEPDAFELRPLLTSLTDPPEKPKRYQLEIRGDRVGLTITDPPPVRYLPVEPYELAEVVERSDEPLKLDRLLEEEVVLAELAIATDRLVSVGITLKETLALPRLPKLLREPRESAGNQAVLSRRESLVERIREARAPEYERFAAELESQHGGRVEETFWLINGVVAELPLSEVRAVAERPDVQFVESVEKSSPLPANQSIDARNRMNSDWLRNYETTGTIGLIDSGVRWSHTLLNGRIGVARDCYRGSGLGCTDGTALDPLDQCDHGTSSASELTANSNLGDANRGVSSLLVNSWKKNNAACGTETTPAVRAILASVAWGDDIIVPEIQERSSGSTGMVSTAADNAFDQGVAVIAPAGNWGDNGAGTVSAPGNARKVLAVGAADVTTLALQSYSGRGPYESRTKPDILGLTNVNAASAASNSALRLFTGTSAATPNAAGLASGVWSYLGRPQPGYVYAAMLALGINSFQPATDNNKGAGVSVWRKTPSDFFCGSRSVSNATVVETVNVPSLPNLIDVAIWWPEAVATGHKDINLTVVTPNGSSNSSSSSGGVFEKVNVRYNMSAGAWTIRLVPATSFGTPTVYWCMAVKY